MEIKVSQPEYSKEFQERLDLGLTKGATAEVEEDSGTDLSVIAKVSDRITGKFLFKKDEEMYILSKKHIIERDFYPLEVSIASLAKYLKRKKIKFILW